VGQVTDLDYAMSGIDWLDFTQAFNATGQVVEQSSPQSSQVFGYDGSDRLSTAQARRARPRTERCPVKIEEPLYFGYPSASHWDWTATAWDNANDSGTYYNVGTVCGSF